MANNDITTARDEQPPPSWARRIIFIVIVSGVLSVLAALVWPAIEKPLGLGALNLSRFSVAMIVSFTFSTISALVYFVADKTLWQFMQIIVVPLALTIVGFWFTAQQDTRQQRIENQRVEAERVLADQRAQDEALQAYLDQMSQLMLDRKLLEAEQGDPVYTLAQARTSTVILSLDAEHNESVTRFLIHSGLAVRSEHSVRILRGIPLSHAKLSGAHLSNADLRYADLSGADLSGAELLVARLRGASLVRTNLKGASLSDADLRGGAVLNDAILDHADLSDALGLTNEELEQQARSLESATMPNGQKYEDWLKDKKAQGKDEKNE